MIDNIIICISVNHEKQAQKNIPIVHDFPKQLNKTSMKEKNLLYRLKKKQKNKMLIKEKGSE